MRVRFVAVAAALLLVLTIPVEAKYPDVADRATTPRVQAVVDGLMKIPEVKQAFENGDTLLVIVNDSRWHGTVAAGKVELSEGDLPGATHTVKVDPNAMLSIINAYDQGNTAKLAVKKQYMTAHSERAAVNLAIGAIARTPADARLATYDPAVGQIIRFQGCEDRIHLKENTSFIATHCGRYGIVIDAIGGVVGLVPQQHLSAAVALANQSVGLRVFDGAAFSLSSDLIEEAGDAVDEDGEEMDEENAKKKAKKAAKAVKNARGRGA